MSVQKFLDKIKNGRYGADITDAIIGGIKKCYDDASVNHDNANMEVKMARGTHNTLNDRLDNVDEIQAQTNAQLSHLELKIEGSVNIHEFKSDVIGDDWTNAIKKAVEKCNDERKKLYFPNGRYLISSTIDFSDLKSNQKPNETREWRSFFILEGESQDNTIFVGADGLKKMFVYNPQSKEQRRFTFKNFRVVSTENYDDLEKRASLKAIDLKYCAFSEFENISTIGITGLIEVAACWGSKFKNITGSRCDRGIFLNGVNLDNNKKIGWADLCLFDNCGFGGFAREFGLKIVGSEGTVINQYDSEGGYTGPAIIVQGCKNLKIENGYFESFVDANPISIIHYDDLSTITAINRNIEINGCKFHGCNSGVHPIKVKGVDGLCIKNNILSSSSSKTETSIIGFYPTDGRELLYFNRNIYCDNSNKGVNDGMLQFREIESYMLSFITNEIIYYKNDNFKYYQPTLLRGSKLIPHHSYNSAYSSIDVVESGTYGTLPTINATIKSGSNKISCDTVEGIKVNTYISVGDFDGIVREVSEDTNEVICQNFSSIDATGTIIYKEPVLKYHMKFFSGSTNENESSAKSKMSNGDVYFHTTKRFTKTYYDGELYPQVQAGFATLQAGAEFRVTFNTPYHQTVVPSVIVSTRTENAKIYIKTIQPSYFILVSDIACSVCWHAMASTQ